MNFSAVVVERSILKAFFEQKGVVTVPVTKDMDVKNMDHYIEIAIEAGAEDVILTPNEEEESTEYVLKVCISELNSLQKMTKQHLYH